MPQLRSTFVTLNQQLKNRPCEVFPMFEKLSKYVLVSVLSDWLNVDEFCALDCAVCNTISRPLFLALHHIKVAQQRQNTAQSSFLYWVKLRNIYLTSLSAKSSDIQILAPFDLLSHVTSLSLTEAPANELISQLLVECGNSLSELSVGVVNLQNDTVVNIGNNCPKNLLKLNFTASTDKKYPGNTAVQDDSLVFLSSKCPSLQSIHLSSLICTTGAMVEAFAQNCPQLTSFSLDNSSTGRPESLSLSALSTHCPQLTELSLTGSLTVDIGCMESVFTHCQNITTLNLAGNNRSFCVFILKKLLEAAKHTAITTLNISKGVVSFKAPGVDYRQRTTVGVSELLALCPNITSLDMSGSLLKVNEDAILLADLLLRTTTLKEVFLNGIFIPPCPQLENLKAVEGLRVENELKPWQQTLYDQMRETEARVSYYEIK